MSPDVVIRPCPTYDLQICRSALISCLAPLGGLSWVHPGMRIGIKANLVSAMDPKKAATTHPVLLKALVELLLERGAAVVIGDSPGGLYTAAYVGRIYRATGMHETGAELNRDFSVAECEDPSSLVCKQFTYTAWLDGCDALINFCKLKSHGMMGMSATAKNLFGVIPGTMKPEYHFRFSDPRDFASMIVDLDQHFKPRLNLVDAVVGMEGNGPTAGTPKPLGCILAGESPHAVDLLCAALIGLAPAEIPTLQAAIERGLCPDQHTSLNIDGPWEQCVCQDFALVRERSGLQFQNKMPGKAGELFSAFLSRYLASRPQVQKALCIGCRKCAQVCPAKAIEMRRGKPSIRHQACIRCFCCQEFCPKGAMKVSRSSLASLLVPDARRKKK